MVLFVNRSSNVGLGFATFTGGNGLACFRASCSDFFCYFKYTFVSIAALCASFSIMCEHVAKALTASSTNYLVACIANRGVYRSSSCSVVKSMNLVASRANDCMACIIFISIFCAFSLDYGMESIELKTVGFIVKPNGSSAVCAYNRGELGVVAALTGSKCGCIRVGCAFCNSSVVVIGNSSIRICLTDSYADVGAAGNSRYRIAVRQYCLLI